MLMAWVMNTLKKQNFGVNFMKDLNDGVSCVKTIC